MGSFSNPNLERKSTLTGYPVYHIRALRSVFSFLFTCVLVFFITSFHFVLVLLSSILSPGICNIAYQNGAFLELESKFFFCPFQLFPSTFIIIIISASEIHIFLSNLPEDTRLRSWLRHYATNRKVAGSNLDKVIVLFN
jgi:hypothetical protein